eukprot:365632-Chlamydomonas_euryale.AAC.12
MPQMLRACQHAAGFPPSPKRTHFALSATLCKHTCPHPCCSPSRLPRIPCCPAATIGCSANSPRQPDFLVATPISRLAAYSPHPPGCPLPATPLALCLEGYYDDTIFHRIIKDYLVQGGDPTGTGDCEHCKPGLGAAVTKLCVLLCGHAKGSARRLSDHRQTLVQHSASGCCRTVGQVSDSVGPVSDSVGPVSDSVGPVSDRVGPVSDSVSVRLEADPRHKRGARLRHPNPAGGQAA